jgi:hypothetical protein
MRLLEILCPACGRILNVGPTSGGYVLKECPLAGSGTFHHLPLLLANVPRSLQLVESRHANPVRFDGRKHLVEIPWANLEKHIPDQVFINRHIVQIVCFATEV